MSELTLYVDANYASPWALSVFVALEEKQLPFQLATKLLSKKETFDAGFGARTKKIPALRRGDFWLAESMAITEYLAESFPFPEHPRLYPENLEERAMCREVQLWLRTDFMPIRQERPTSTLYFARASTPLSADALEATKKLIDAVEPLLAHGRPTLFAQWCIADVDLAVMLQRLNLNGTPLAPKLKAYAEANWARPSVAKWNALPRGNTQL
ncbi:MAG: glutathione transferase [Archangium sp.]|nr:glutathione transferase [Archangium sp.]MDP3569661.1 glutathione transferase [Archangium sp.]